MVPSPSTISLQDLVCQVQLCGTLIEPVESSTSGPSSIKLPTNPRLTAMQNLSHRTESQTSRQIQPLPHPSMEPSARPIDPVAEPSTLPPLNLTVPDTRTSPWDRSNNAPGLYMPSYPPNPSLPSNSYQRPVSSSSTPSSALFAPDSTSPSHYDQHSFLQSRNHVLRTRIPYPISQITTIDHGFSSTSYGENIQSVDTTETTTAPQKVIGPSRNILGSELSIFPKGVVFVARASVCDVTMSILLRSSASSAVVAGSRYLIPTSWFNSNLLCNLYHASSSFLESSCPNMCRSLNLGKPH